MPPTSYRTVAEATRGLQARGFRENFEVVGDRLTGLNSGQHYGADEVTIVEHHRFEGASDPDDLSIVYAIEARDGSRGVLVDAYGTYATPQVSAFLKTVPIKEEPSP